MNTESRQSNCKFSWRELFSEVFKSHSEDELEQHWASGTIGNIPSLDNVSLGWPKPWVFIRVFALTFIVYLTFLFCWNKFHATNLLPGLIIIGTAAIPLSILIFFFEMNARRNLSIYLVSKMLILGGAVSIFFSLFMFKVTAWCGLGWMGASVAGVAEEIGKFLAVILVIRKVRYPYILNGILFGAAIGTGFAIFESAGYALNILIMQIIDFSVSNSEKIISLAKDAASSGSSGQDILSGLFQVMATKFDTAMLNNISMRGLLAPFGHIVWTAMAVGALWQVKGNKKFECGMLVDIRFVWVMVAAMGLHMIWNSPWEINLLCEYDKNILLGIIGWGIVFHLLKMGLDQIAEEKEKYTEAPQKEPGVSEILQTQEVYVEKLVFVSDVRKSTDSEENHGYDHLGIHGETVKSSDRERARQRPDFSSRAWEKYYERGKDEK